MIDNFQKGWVFTVKNSILIFLVLSSTTSTFYYVLKRSKGNIGQSIMFTMYYLSIKLNLIGPNVIRLLDQSQFQLNQEILRVLAYSRCRVDMAKIE